MKHYKDSENRVYAYEADGSQDAFILDGLTPISDEEAAELSSPPPTPEQIEALRRAAYQAEADPLFFKAQRGEATHEDWLAKVAEIKARFPE
jgi:hypothetical protein